jgi:AcrR family transcriptional regulator
MYYYFASKEALVEELLNRNATHSWKYVQHKIASLPPTASYRDRLITAARASLSNVLGEENDEVIVHMRLLNEIPADMRARLLSHATISRHFVRDLIRNGQEAGEFRPDVNPTVVALMLFSNLVWAYDWFRPARDHTIDELAHDMCHILLSGIEQREPAPQRVGRRAGAVGQAGRRTAPVGKPVRAAKQKTA